MPQIIPVRKNREYKLKYEGLSVEQLVLKDYTYFRWMTDELENGERFRDFNKQLRDRIDYADFVVNNFKSVKNCSYEDCQNPARHISIYHSGDDRVSGLNYIYCSEDCFNKDPKVERYKSRLEKLAADSALSPTKADTNKIIKEIIAPCMGIDKRYTQEYLEDLFYQLETLEPYKNQLTLF